MTYLTLDIYTILILCQICIGKPEKTRGLLLSIEEEPSVIIDNPKNVISQVFQDCQTEYIPLSKYAHAIVDAHAVLKNLKPNVNATNLFRTIFKIYNAQAVVKGNCLIYGSLNLQSETEYNNYSVPYDYIIFATRTENINFYGYE